MRCPGCFVFRAGGIATQQLHVRRAPLASKARRNSTIYAAAAVQTQTLKIGTRGSPLALAQAYLTRDLLKVRYFQDYFKYRRVPLSAASHAH